MTDTKREIEKLIERLEKATGRDHDLDADIAILVDWKRPEHKTTTIRECAKRFPEHKIYYSAELNVPAYTASIDAALTLKPEGSGAGFDLLGNGNTWGAGDTKARAWINQSEDQWTYSGWDGAVAETAPLALCIAALKARARMEADQ